MIRVLRPIVHAPIYGVVAWLFFSIGATLASAALA